MDDKLRFYYKMSEERYNEIFKKKEPTTDELLERFKRGERIHTKHSLHSEERTDLNCVHQGNWRCILCDGDEDVIECFFCGK